MPIHIVRQGECLSSIAVIYGFRDYHAIYNHPKNSELKTKRPDPNIIYADDRLYIPDKKERPESRPTSQVHPFEVKTPQGKFILRLLKNGKPRANEKYRLVIDGQAKDGVTGSDGKIEVVIAPTAKQANLSLSENKEKYTLQLGYLDPVEEISGIKARLKNLGYYSGDVDSDQNKHLEAVIKKFQQDKNLPKTGKPDAALQAALKSEYGS